MRCPRCRGMMVEDRFEDLADDTGALNFKGWRCVLCGEVLDPVIAAHRVTRPGPIVSRTRKRYAAQLS